MKIAITTDSTADVSNEFFENNNINFIPLIVNLGDEERFDLMTIKNEDIYNHVAKTKQLPKTAARSIADFKEFFDSVLAKGYDQIVHISISEDLSCCYSNAVSASNEYPKDKIYVVNSRSLSTGTMLLVLYAKELVEQGLSAQKIAERTQARAYNVQASFVVETIEYLYRGGRCSMMAALGANLLKLKPKLQICDGKIISEKPYYRGKQVAVLKKYIDDTLAKYNNPDKKYCFVTHADFDDAKEIVDYVKSKNIFEQVIETRANSTIYSHCGKGTLGILYINDGGKC